MLYSGWHWSLNNFAPCCVGGHGHTRLHCWSSTHTVISLTEKKHAAWQYLEMWWHLVHFSNMLHACSNFLPLLPKTMKYFFFGNQWSTTPPGGWPFCNQREINEKNCPISQQGNFVGFLTGGGGLGQNQPASPKKSTFNGPPGPTQCPPTPSLARCPPGYGCQYGSGQ